MAHWARDGRELIYLAADGGLRSVDISATPTFRAGPPRLLFQVSETLPPLAAGFCLGEKSLGTVSRDGQRFVFAEPVVPPRRPVSVDPQILTRYTGNI